MDCRAGRTICVRTRILLCLGREKSKNHFRSFTSLDRNGGSPLQEFLQNVLQIGTKDRPIYAPWVFKVKFWQNVNDEIIREMADRAAKAGMRTLQIDMGWQRGSLGTEPDTNKFANFVQTSHTLRDLGLKLGLWVSVFRDKESKDMHLFPNLVSCPLLRRKGHTRMVMR
jgi:hypothetical protein